MRKALAALAVSLAIAGCAGLPPIVDGARFMVLAESGVDAVQLDFPSQALCRASAGTVPSKVWRCQRTTLDRKLPVQATVRVPDGTVIDAHFATMERCSMGLASRADGITLASPCEAKPGR